MSRPLLDRAGVGELAGRIAPALTGLGLADGDCVVVVARNRPEAIVVEVAAAACGARTLHVDPDGPAAEADRVLAETGPSLVVCEHAEQVPFVRARARSAVVVVLTGGTDCGSSPGTVAWSQLAGETSPQGGTDVGRRERVLCDAHLSVPGTAATLGRLLDRGAAVALVAAPADRDAVSALRPAAWVTTRARVDGLARELHRRAPAGDERGHRLLVAALAAVPSIAWAIDAAAGLATVGARATVATGAALVLAVVAVVIDRRRAATVVVGVGAASALACDAAGVAPSLVAGGRFVAATVPVAALLAVLARASREIAWSRAIAATRRSGRAGLGRFAGRRVCAALGLPGCRRILVVGDPPAAGVLADLAVTGLVIETVGPAAPVPPTVLAPAADDSDVAEVAGEVA